MWIVFPQLWEGHHLNRPSKGHDMVCKDNSNHGQESISNTNNANDLGMQSKNCQGQAMAKFMRTIGEQPIPGKWTPVEHCVFLGILHHLGMEIRSQNYLMVLLSQLR